MTQTSVSVSMFLHDKPGRAMDNDGAPTTAGEIGAYAEWLRIKLEATVAALFDLEADGWGMQMMLYHVELSHPEVHTVRDARRRIKGLGLDPKAFQIDTVEFDDAE